MTIKVILAVLVLIISGCSVHTTTMSAEDMKKASCAMGYRSVNGKVSDYESYVNSDDLYSDEIKRLLIDKYHECLNKDQ